MGKMALRCQALYSLLHQEGKTRITFEDLSRILGRGLGIGGPTARHYVDTGKHAGLWIVKRSGFPARAVIELTPQPIEAPPQQE